MWPFGSLKASLADVLLRFFGIYLSATADIVLAPTVASGKVRVIQGGVAATGLNEFDVSNDGTDSRLQSKNGMTRYVGSGTGNGNMFTWTKSDDTTLATLAGNGVFTSGTITVSGAAMDYNAVGEITARSTGRIGFSSTPSPAAAQDTTLVRIAAGVQGYAAGSWPQNTAGVSRTTAQNDATTTTFAQVTGTGVGGKLASTLKAGRTYKFWARLPVTADAVGGYKVKMDTPNTLTATTIYYDVEVVANGVAPSLSRQSALAGSAGGTLGTTVAICVQGLITVNAAGDFGVYFAQNAANGMSSVLVGADLLVEDYV